tara:strand:- start:19 stop:1329 length:1311 start_codon:yes stop_codon:yes gene_type:complete
MNNFLLFITGVFSGIFAGLFFSKRFWRRDSKRNRDIELILKERLKETDLEKDEYLRNISSLHESLDILRTDKEQLSNEVTQFKEKLNSAEKQAEILKDSRNDLKTQFKVLSEEMLKNSREELINISRSKVTEPFSQEVAKLTRQVKMLSDESKEKLAALTQTTNDLKSRNDDVKGAALELAKALRSPDIKGKWGEVTLKRTMEYVGLNRYCDFDEQVTFTTDDGTYRPDCVIKIPGERIFIIDSKTPIDSYQEVLKAKDDRSQKLALDNHLRKIRNHIDQLSRKDYSNNLRTMGVVLDGVIMFIPIEGALSMALSQDEKLLEYAFDRKVILTFPTSFLAILKNLSMNINQAKLTRDIEDIYQKAGNLHNALILFIDKFNNIGKRIKQIATSYNDALGTLRGNLLPKGKSFADLTGKNEDFILEDDINENEINQISK